MYGEATLLTQLGVQVIVFIALSWLISKEYIHQVYWMWKYYGDDSIIEDQYDGIKLYVDYLTSLAESYRSMCFI